MSVSNYPAVKDSFSQKIDNSTEIIADNVNYLQSAVRAIQDALGINPQGTADTVVARLSAALNSDGSFRPNSIIASMLAPGLAGAYTQGSDLTLKGMSDEIINARQAGEYGSFPSLNAAINYIITHIVPIGGIIAWAGAITGNFNSLGVGISDTLKGWALCDGQGGRPDLRDQFLQMVAAGEETGIQGGSHTKVLLEANLPPHAHSGTTNAAGTHSHNIGHVHYIDSVTTGGPSSSFFSGGGATPAADFQHTHTIAGRWSNYSSPNYSDTTLSSSSGQHAHDFVSGSGNGISTPVDIRPKYYKVAFIIRI